MSSTSSCIFFKPEFFLSSVLSISVSSIGIGDIVLFNLPVLGLNLGPCDVDTFSFFVPKPELDYLLPDLKDVENFDRSPS